MTSCVKNVCTKNYYNVSIFFKSQTIMLGMLFDVFLFILMHISLVYWPVVPEIFVPKIVAIGRHFFE